MRRFSLLNPTITTIRDPCLKSNGNDVLPGMIREATLSVKKEMILRGFAMNIKKLLAEIRDHFDVFIGSSGALGQSLWNSFLLIHPADKADFLENLDPHRFKQIMHRMPGELRIEVFSHLPDSLKVVCLSELSDAEQAALLDSLPIDDLTDLFDFFEDEELKHYLGLLNKRVRQNVLSLLQFDPDSAGGIMDSDVIALHADYTVEKTISILQRLQPKREMHQELYVVNGEHRLVGHIHLEDLVLQDPKARIGAFMDKNELLVRVNEDKEKVAQDMMHYGLMIAPVVDRENHFLGVIPSETLVDVISDEAREDVARMSALSPLKYPYFETSTIRIFWERGYILIALLILESFSSSILHAYEATLTALLISLIPMLISAGGNTSSQSSAMVIQGMASGEINIANFKRFLKKELLVTILLALSLGGTAFLRVYLTGGTFLETLTASLALGSIVLISSVLGSCIPFLLKRLNLDPAFSAGPFLATIMDIVGIMIFCYLSKAILFG